MGRLGGLSRTRQLQTRSFRLERTHGVRGLQSMGFDNQLCTEAALCTGNESIEKAARWLVEALEQHKLARKEQHDKSTPAVSVQEDPVVPVSPAAIGFVEKLTAALTGGAAIDQTDDAHEAKEDGWEVVSTDVQE